jgi:cysteine-rich repeat protein
MATMITTEPATTTGDESATGDGVCGNGIEDEGEGCDDGNNADDDGCNAACQQEFCGDGVVQASEACDLGGNNDQWEAGGCVAECTREIDGPLEIRVTPFIVPANLHEDEEMKGTAAADATCADAFDEGFKAMVVDKESRRATVEGWKGDGLDWVLAPYTAYVTGEGGPIGVTGKERLLGIQDGNFVSVAAIGGMVSVWTGLAEDWSTANTNCNQWQSVSDGFVGTVGIAAIPEKLFVAAFKPCNSSAALYCVEQ